MTLATALARSEFWQRASTRERVLLVVGAAVVIGALMLTFVALPLARFVADAPALHAQRLARLADAEARVATLAKPAPVPAPSRSSPADALGRALDAAGVARAAASIDVTADRIALTLPSARIAEVAAVMSSAARDGLVVSAATLSARAPAAVMRNDRGADANPAPPGDAAVEVRAEIAFMAAR